MVRHLPRPEPEASFSLLLRSHGQTYQPFLFCSPGLKMTSNIIQRDNMILSLDEFLAPIAGLRSQWKLCYRASSHGWAASTFHSRCDGKVNTITVIRKTPYVFGGYTDVSWGENINVNVNVLLSKGLRF